MTMHTCLPHYPPSHLACLPACLPALLLCGTLPPPSTQTGMAMDMGTSGGMTRGAGMGMTSEVGPGAHRQGHD